MVANPEVDAFVARSRQWAREMALLRPILVGCGLTEELKWAKPCYTHRGANIVIIQPMKETLALMFFKGALVHDPAGVLEAQGPSSRSARRIRFTSVDDVTRLEGTVKELVERAIAVEDAGQALGPAPTLVLVDELQARLDADPVLRAAFEALTPGRRREYNLYVAGAKQAATRAARVEACVARILEGKGRRDR